MYPVLLSVLLSVIVDESWCSLFDTDIVAQYKDAPITCADGEDCTIICDLEEACRGSTIKCPTDSLCDITCTQNRACQQASITWPETPSLRKLRIYPQRSTAMQLIFPIPDANTALTYDCSGPETCSLSTIYCPTNAVCDITCGFYGCKDTNIIWPLVAGLGQLTCNPVSLACYGIDFPIPDPNIALTITCTGDRNCAHSTIYCPTDADCIVSCSGSMACDGTVVVWPTNPSVNDQLICSNDENVCRNVNKPPTSSPTSPPSEVTQNPSKGPTNNPTPLPTKSPTRSPTTNPSQSPSKGPSDIPTENPTPSPTHGFCTSCIAGYYLNDGECMDIPNGGNQYFIIRNFYGGILTDNDVLSDRVHFECSLNSNNQIWQIFDNNNNPNDNVECSNINNFQIRNYETGKWLYSKDRRSYIKLTNDNTDNGICWRILNEEQAVNVDATLDFKFGSKYQRLQSESTESYPDSDNNCNDMNGIGIVIDEHKDDSSLFRFEPVYMINNNNNVNSGNFISSRNHKFHNNNNNNNFIWSYWLIGGFIISVLLFVNILCLCYKQCTSRKSFKYEKDIQLASSDDDMQNLKEYQI